MTEIFRRLFGGGKAAAESGDPRLTLAAFGKHPGWDDYLGSGVDTGIGVDTETLSHVKHALHTDGIRGQIDSGAWDKLEPANRLEGFDHTFLWLRAGHVILGQIWSSTDGKRRRYPMVLCIDGEGVAPGFVLAKVRPELKRLRAACQAATTAEQVTAECRAAQERLQSLLTDSDEKDSEPFLPIQARRRFLAHPALEPERLGLLRTLHELGITREMLVGGGKPESLAGANARTCHLRLPLASDLLNEGLSLWAAFLRCAIPDSVPLLLIKRSGMEWIDVVVGEPASDDLFWLQASLQGSPLTTEIPFELSPDLKPRLELLEARFLGAEPAAAKAPAPAPTVPPASVQGAEAAAPTPVSVTQAPTPSPTPTKTPAPLVAPEPVTSPRTPVAKAVTVAPVPVAKPAALASAPVAKSAAPADAGVSAGPPVQKPTAARTKTGLIAGGGATIVIIAAGLLWFNRDWLSGPVDLTVTAESRNRTYGEANPPLTGVIAGQREGDEISVTYRTTADTRSPIGRYDIVPVLSDPKGKLGRYRLITNNGTLTITPAELIVTASNQSRAYGSVNPPLTGSIQGLRNGDGITVTCHTKADPKSAVRSYDIVPEPNGPTNKLSNYTVTTMNGTLTITPLPLTVAAKNQRRAYRTANPPLTVIVEGLRDDDGITVTGRTKADENSPVGNYDIEPEIKDPAKRLGNYAATVGKGILAITPAVLTVTANNQRREYGTTNPPLTGWITPNADEISATYSTVADAGSPAGDYRITPTLRDPKNKLGNYTVTTNLGWLTILPAVVTSAVPVKPSGEVPGTFTNGIGMEFVWRSAVPPQGVYFGRYEVTQKQYQTVLGRLPTFQPAEGDNLPVANVAFTEAQEFCNVLTAREHRTYALPSREEWLAAAQMSEDQVANAWDLISGRGLLQHEVTSATEVRKAPEAVGSRGAQTNGLCDLFGNLREWVVGKTAEERAGFSYHSGRGRTKDLFLPASAAEPWALQEIGFRCILRK